MQQIITAKLKLLTTPEQHQLLRQTQLAYRDALNYVSRYSFEHGKMSNIEIAKSIIVSHPHTLIGLEDLTGIREHTKRRRKRRKKQGKGVEPVSQKARRANRHASQWAFAELHNMLSYKAAVAGSLAIKVDADYTSQSCPYCGYADKQNRPGKGLLFICQHEQCPYRLRIGQAYTLHADLVGARNIAMRTLLARQDWVRTGVLSVRASCIGP